MPFEAVTDSLDSPVRETAPADAGPPARDRSSPRLVAYELVVSLPLLAAIALAIFSNPQDFASPMLLVWAVGIAAIDLMPLPLTSNMHFSLSFPLQLAVALLYPPFVAGAVALVGTSDPREFRLQISPLKALFIRAQIGVSVVVEAALFHSVASVDSIWYLIGVAVVVATLAGYAVNVGLVAGYVAIARRLPMRRVIAEMHEGILGELVISYMGLAIFGVVIATFFVEAGLVSLVVFVAPLMFARQMFARTH